MVADGLISSYDVSMLSQVAGKRPLFTPLQILLLLTLILSLFAILRFQNRSETGDAIEAAQVRVQADIDAETERKVQLEATLEFIESDAFVEAWARNGGQIQVGDTIVSPMITPVPAQPSNQTPPVDPPAEKVYQWQGWWRLLTDAPYPREP